MAPWQPLLWALATVPVVLVLSAEIVVSLRHGQVGLDIVALLSMVGALALEEPLAGVVIALMYSGGQFLEGFAARRARREMTALLERAPKFALRHEDGDLRQVPIEAWYPATGCWSGAARWCRRTAPSPTAATPCSTSRR